MKARLNSTFFRDSYLPAHDFRTPDYSAARRRYLHDSPAEGKTSFPAVSSCSCRLRGKVVAAYILDPRAADQAERQVEVRNQVAHYVPDPVLAVDREAIAVRAAQQHGLGAQGKRLEDIGASADAAIEQDRYSSRDGFHDAGQGIQRGNRPIQLPAAVVGNDDAVHAVLDRTLRIVRVQDAFEQDRQAGVLPQECQVIPCEAGIGVDLAEGFDRLDEMTLWLAADDLLEHRIAKVVRQTLALKEGQIRVLHIAFAPGEQKRIERYNQRAVAGPLGPLHEADYEIGIVGPVKLKPARRVGHLRGHFLHRVRRDSAEHKRHPERPGRAVNGQLALLVQYALHADGREQDGRREPLTQQLDAQVPLGHVPQIARHDAPAPKRLAIGAHRVLPARPAGQVVERLRLQLLPGLLFERIGRNRRRRCLARQAQLVNLHLPLLAWTTAVRLLRHLNFSD